MRNVTLCLTAFAQLAFVAGDGDRAALLAGVAEGLRERVGLRRGRSSTRGSSDRRPDPAGIGRGPVRPGTRRRTPARPPRGGGGRPRGAEPRSRPRQASASPGGTRWRMIPSCGWEPPRCSPGTGQQQRRLRPGGLFCRWLHGVGTGNPADPRVGHATAARCLQRVRRPVPGGEDGRAELLHPRPVHP
jgi:hypothetical protein